MHIGVVVNPIAGMGGRVGLKGTDNNVETARQRGATPRAPKRARAALAAIANSDRTVTVHAAPGMMGADEARAAGLDPVVLSVQTAPAHTHQPATTTAADTQAAVDAAVDAGVDVILFVGGDGTAADVAAALDARDADTPMLGVPAGVKVYSGVFAVSPDAAGRIVTTFDRTVDREVNDLDEDAYRDGEIQTDVRAVRPVPVDDALQGAKQRTDGSVAGIAAGVAASVTPGRRYVLGPGGTLNAVKAELGVSGTPIGVDVWEATAEGGRVLVQDATESEILDVIDGNHVVVVSPIGGQGFVFGRGNDQISPAVLAEATVEIVAAPDKLDTLDVLRVDLDDPTVAESLRGWQKVRTGRVSRRMLRVV